MIDKYQRCPTNIGKKSDALDGAYVEFVKYFSSIYPCELYINPYISVTLHAKLCLKLNDNLLINLSGQGHSNAIDFLKVYILFLF